MSSMSQQSSTFQNMVTLEEKIQIGKHTINYIKVGTGPKLLLCFPGTFGTIWNDFKPQIDHLNRDLFTIIAWDPPGYGKSRPPNRKFASDCYYSDAEIATSLLQKLGIDKCSLLGWCSGGISSIIMAANNKIKVEKLVIWGSGSYLTKEEIEFYKRFQDIQNLSEKISKPLIEIYTENYFKTLVYDWCESLIEIFEKNNGDICKNLLPKVTCPTLVLHGDLDPMIAPEHPEFLLKNIPNSEYYNFPKGKHNIHLRYAEDFNKIVTEFLLK